MTGLAERVNAPESVPYPGAHLGLHWRPMIASDAPGVYDLCRRTEAADDAIHRTSVMEVADMVEGCRGRDCMDTIVGLDSAHQIAVVASVRVLRDIRDRAIAVVNAVVDTRWRGRGVGRSLLYWQDGRARQMLVEVFGKDCKLPASIQNLVDSHMTDRRRLYIAAGFSAKRTFRVMYRELEGSEQELEAPPGYLIKSWNEVDRVSVRGTHMEVFTEHYGASMRGRWFNDAMWIIDDRWSSVVFGPEGDVAAYCIVGRPAARWVSTGRTEAYIDLLGVRKEHRGKRLASLMLSRAIARAARTGMSRIGLDVDTRSASGAHAIYEHHGFVDDRAEVLYSIDH